MSLGRALHEPLTQDPPDGASRRTLSRAFAAPAAPYGARCQEGDLKNVRACAYSLPGTPVLHRHRALALALIVFALPVRLEAQPAPKVAKIGLLTPSTPAGSGHLVEAFRQGLRELGYIEGTFVLEARYGDGRSEHL